MQHTTTLTEQIRSQYVTEAQAADALEVKVGTLKNWRSNEIGPAWVKVGRHVRYPVAGILAFLEKRTRKAAS